MTPEQILHDLDAMSISTTTAAAALIRELQQKVDYWEAMAVRDLKNGISHEVETIHDRDARAAMAWLLAHPKPQGMSGTIAATAVVLADALADLRAERAKRGR